MRTRRTQSSSDSVPARHHSVLLHEARTQLRLTPGSTVLDATLGGAGHARVIAHALGAQGTFVGIDADPAALDRAREALRGERVRTVLVHGNFRDLATLLPRSGVSALDGALFDLGWSAYQLTAGRGFSFQEDAPLLMTYGPKREPPFSAAEIVNEWSESALADIIFGWGEERLARRIARAIAAQRSVQPFTTARELGEFIARVVPAWYRRGRLHPATRTFQALRIAVNDELGAIRDGLEGFLTLANPGAVCAVITFHSIEDRLVKRIFAQWVKEGKGTVSTKKPIRPSADELAGNPRARSAKLRVCVLV